jgi:HD-GYP domain-containing protein (c-di-GMP phosphodiesterase class II)
METHVKIGYEILNRISFLAGAAEIVLAHHEQWDGSGYPQGLKGEEIPLGARIFAVADTLDAITSDRPYRRAQAYGAARAEIARVSGSQLDPAVVSVFLSISEATWESVRQGTEARLSGLVTKSDAAYACLADKGLVSSAAIAGM